MNTNNASSGVGQRPECAALASLLALRDTGMLDAEEADIVERHVASCDACQRDTALDAALAGHLREALISHVSVESALTVRQIADAVAERDAADSVVGDAGEEERPGAVRCAAMRWHGTAGRFGGLSALAAALAVVLLATYIFGSHHAGTTHPGPVAPTVTLSPRLAQETVYLPTGNGIYALRASDGVVRWVFPAGITTVPMLTLQTIFGLSLDHGTLYALTTAPEGASFVYHGPRLYALNAINGSVRWNVSVPDPSAASLLQVGRFLVVAPLGSGAQAHFSVDNQTILAFDTANGNLVWRRTLDEPTYSRPVADGGSVYIGTTGHVVALSAADGTVRWTTPIVPSAQQEETNPANSNSSVALAVSSGRVYVLAKRAMKQGSGPSGAWESTWEANLYALAASDGSHIWRDSVENDPWGTAFAPTLVGDTAYVPFDGGITAISLAGSTPEQHWRFIPEGSTMPNAAMAGAAVSGGIVYTTELTGVIAHRDGLTFQENCTYAVRASDGAELWRTPSDGGTMAAPPVVADGLVFAPAAATLRVFRAGDGRPFWQYIPPGGSLTATPLVGP